MRVRRGTRTRQRHVGIQLKLANVGEVDYDDSPGNGAKLITDDDQEANTTTITEGPCGSSFGSETRIAPGDQRQGCIVFEVPQGAKFQLTFSSGFADDAGEWEIP